MDKNHGEKYSSQLIYAPSCLAMALFIALAYPSRRENPKKLEMNFSYFNSGIPKIIFPFCEAVQTEGREQIRERIARCSRESIYGKQRQHYPDQRYAIRHFNREVAGKRS